LDGGSIPSPRPRGVGIDLAEPNAFEHLDAPAVDRAAARWLSPAERAWCAAQPSFRQAMVTVLSCKESVCKATGGSVAVQAVSVAMDGEWPQGWARAAGVGPDPVTLWWEVTSIHILTVGVAGPIGSASLLLNRIVRGRRTAQSS
jgi:hypothetical protein